MLLKASDFVAHDLDHAYDGCADAAAEGEDSEAEAGLASLAAGARCLVLRKWSNLNPAMVSQPFPPPPLPPL